MPHYPIRGPSQTEGLGKIARIYRVNSQRTEQRITTAVLCREISEASAEEISQWKIPAA